MGKKRVVVYMCPGLQVSMNEDGHIRFHVPGASFPLDAILARLVRAWVERYGICNTADV